MCVCARVRVFALLLRARARVCCFINTKTEFFSIFSCDVVCALNLIIKLFSIFPSPVLVKTRKRDERDEREHVYNKHATTTLSSLCVSFFFASTSFIN